MLKRCWSIFSTRLPPCRAQIFKVASARAARALGNLEAGLFNSLGDAVVATDLNGYIIFWSSAAESLYGWTADEVEGRNIIDILTSANSRALGIAIFEKLTKGERWSGEFETRHKDGHALLIITDYPVRGSSGETDFNRRHLQASQSQAGIGRRSPPSATSHRPAAPKFHLRAGTW